MSNIVNLRQVRKNQKRASKDKTAEENRIEFGRKKSEKKQINFEKNKNEKLLSGKKLDDD